MVRGLLNAGIGHRTLPKMCEVRCCTKRTAQWKDLEFTAFVSVTLDLLSSLSRVLELSDIAR